MLNLGLGLNRYNKVGGLLPQTKAHLLRVTSNGGIVEDPKLLNTYINYLLKNNLFSTKLIDAIPHVTGYKIQGDTIDGCLTVFSVDPNGATSGSYIGDMRQTNVLYQSKLLKYSGERYLWSSGITKNNISTVDAEANNLSNCSFDIVFKTKWTDTSLNYPTIIGKYEASGILNYVIYRDVSAGNLIAFQIGATSYNGGSVSGFINKDYYYKLSYDLNTNTAQFYTSEFGTTWVICGSSFTLTTPIINTVNNHLYIGDETSEDLYPMSGNIYFVKIYKEGIKTVDTSLNTYNPAISETTWTSSTGETWTLNTPIGDSNYISTIITRTCILTKLGVFMNSGDFNIIADSGAITRFLINNIQSSNPNASSVLVNSLTHYWEQCIVITNFNYVWGQGTYEFNPVTHMGEDLIYKKTQILTTKFRHSDIALLQVNKNTPHIQTDTTALSLIPTTFSGDMDCNYGGVMALPISKKGHITFSGIIDDVKTAAFQDFINTTLFNSELF